MSTPIRQLALGLLLGSGAMAVHAQAKPAGTTGTVDPAGAEPAAAAAAPIDLTLYPSSLPAPAGPQASLHASATLLPAPSTARPPAGQPAPVDRAAAPAESPDLERITRWIAETRNNSGLPYLVIDKTSAKVLAFDGAGRMQGTAPVLLGMARGDKMLAPNSATMEQMPPDVRITPAGRFVSRLAKDAHGKELLVLDYAASLSLHPVALGKPAERRPARLNSASPDDNRISFGCINVPTAFYKSVVSPAFTGTKGIVYVLPETSSATAFFGVDPVGAVAAGAQPAPAASAASRGAPSHASATVGVQASMAPVAR